MRKHGQLRTAQGGATRDSVGTGETNPKMQLFVIGPSGRGRPQNIGALRDREAPDDRVAKLQPHFPNVPLALHRNATIEKGMETLALRIIGHDIGDARKLQNSWWDVDKARATLAFDKAIRALSLIGEPLPTPDFAGLIRHLRVNVFQTSQPVFGAIGGGVGVSTVSRWENGDIMPNTLQLQRIKRFAEASGLPWDERWLVSPPETAAAGQEAAA
jgi:hypothetical protein